MNTEDVDTFLDVMCYGAMLNLIVQSIQATKTPFLLGCSGPVGLMANPNETGALYVFCLPAFFRRKWILAIPLIGVGLYFARSKMGMVCVGFGLMMWLFYMTDKAKRLNHVYFMAFSVFCWRIHDDSD